ncbi:MAG: FAD-dependent oxidoreductase [Phormidesmis sp. FL-bin-119]|nr:FAD-dependent oxidoreductase [Pedobacter sp.]
MGCCNVNLDNQFDLIIIGGGSAAFASAIKANNQEVKTLVVNGGLPLGGTCVNVGCVPSKVLIRAGESIHKASHSPFRRITPNKPQVNFKEIILETKELVADMQKRKYLDLLEGLPFVKVIEGFAKFIGDNTVEVEGEQYQGLKVIIATGASTSIPPIEGLDTIPYLTNISLFELEELRESLVILGAGYIALEIAQAYSRLGSQVSILQRSASILSKQSKDVSDELTKHLSDDGLTILTETSINKVWKDGETIKISYNLKGIEETITTSHVLVATGTKPNTENLGLDMTGVKVDDKGYIEVDRFLTTSNADIYAVGDVTSLPAYVYTAAYEGGVALHNAFNEPKQEVDFKALPWVVFTDPQIAGVGMDEKRSRGKRNSFSGNYLTIN